MVTGCASQLCYLRLNLSVAHRSARAAVFSLKLNGHHMHVLRLQSVATRSDAIGVVPADSSVVSTDACMQKMTAARLIWTASAVAAARLCHLERPWSVLRTALIRAASKGFQPIG